MALNLTSSGILLCALVLSASYLIPALRRGHLPQPENHVALFIFGDSLFDPGNNNYINTTTDFQANFRPYGESFFKNPTGRFSDGRLIPDFIAERAKLPLIPPYLEPGAGHHQFIDGANFASGGAGALVGVHQGMVIDLKTQLNYFNDLVKLWGKKLGGAEAKKRLSLSFFLFSVGGNDYLSPSLTNSGVFRLYSHKEYVEMVIGNLTSVVEEIYKKGGRKFGFVSQLPLGCLPHVRVTLNPGCTGCCFEEASALAKLHNKALPGALEELAEMKLKGLNYSIFDLYSPLCKRINDPSKYGFEDGKTACCGSGPDGGVYSCGGKRGGNEYHGLCSNVGEHVFFDSYHPTEKVYGQLAELMWSGSVGVPYNLEELFYN